MTKRPTASAAPRGGTARRRLCALSLALATMAVQIAALAHALGPLPWSPPRWAIFACGLGLAPWSALCAANGLIGFALLMLARDPVRAVFPAPAAPHGPMPAVAIAVTIRDEDMAAVLPPLRRLLDGLDASGRGGAFALCLLSDTRDPLHARAEADAVAAFRAADPDPARIRYRRRAGNAGFKAGNIMEFLDNHADAFELMLTLDADSVMSPAAVLRLVDAMRADPALGIAQHLTVGLPAASPFPRLFQFGMRSGMRVWATGQAWWQGDEGPYWGHNAILRIAPFRNHCRLAPLPGGQPILSHDQVEAALLRAAGWGVRVLPEEDGSAEANPPALPEFMRRELRWLAGNMQYRHLLARPGLRPMGRWQLAQAILLFAAAPFETALLGAAAVAAAAPAGDFAALPALWALLAWLGALHAPKLLGYLQLLLSPARRSAYGGSARLLAGIAAETAFTLLLDPIGAFSKTAAMLRLAAGMQPSWLPQNRAGRRVGWAEAVRLFWPHTLAGAAAFAGFVQAGWSAVLWALPFAAGLLLAVPFCVLTADLRFGRWLAAARLAAMPEEVPWARRERARGWRSRALAAAYAPPSGGGPAQTWSSVTGRSRSP